MNYCPRCATPLSEAEHQGVRRPTCPSCGYVYYRDPKLAVAVVAGRDGKVLLARRNHQPAMGLWTFPSGYVDAGEVVEEAAVREAREETGAEVALLKLMAVASEPGNPVVLIVYRGEIVGGVLAPGPEATEVGLFGLDELPELAFPHDLEFIQAWATGREVPLLARSP
ncbi:MAG: NUDIX domain-containing protein [Chloroflexi bacterium]|nr:NUDIX domain-containing protein [Chloroflexota bacterium]